MCFYVRTGTSRSGVSYKFNHPQPAIPGIIFSATRSSAHGFSSFIRPLSGNQLTGGVSPWPLQKIAYISIPSVARSPSLCVPLIQFAVCETLCRHLKQAFNACHGNMNHISYADMLPPNWLANSRHKTQPGCGMPQSLFERPDQPDRQYYIKIGI
ncbi:hypothetical protein C4D60_Mb04t04030 [Musa balbisiana]|uniref:Uncharacterized protein n=1 Tax=Musa balbisiana TaxID=52838 RepID=A0A4S8K9H2_MUSBA|nr:hypothetical protein C4D60_Mb04t04030 [Musa balbisiana]